MTTASEEVLSLPELLEFILQNLKYKKLFVLQRVNRTFHAIISGSLKLKRIMFLAPVNDQPNGLKEIMDKVQQKRFVGVELDGPDLLSGIIHPYLDPQDASFTAFGAWDHFDQVDVKLAEDCDAEPEKRFYFRTVALPYPVTPSSCSSAGSCKSSWRNMLLTRCGWGVNFEVVFKGFDFKKDSRRVYFTLSGEDRMGILVDVMAGLEAHHDQVSEDEAYEQRLIELSNDGAGILMTINGVEVYEELT